MKVYSIGREMGCDIVINDSTDVISRRHAILNVLPSGKMTIVDQSHNGTYVNGIRISPNVPVPVTRKDNISFAHVARLDWNMVPKPVSYTMYVIYALIALAVIIGSIVAYRLLASPTITDKGGDEHPPEIKAEQTDSCTVCKKPVSECEYKGKHPVPEQPKSELDKCKTCGKVLSECQYKGKHPAPSTPEKKCKTCGKPISKCKHGGKHPDPIKKCATCGKPQSECKYKGKHPEIPEVTGGDRH